MLHFPTKFHSKWQLYVKSKNHKIVIKNVRAIKYNENGTKCYVLVCKIPTQMTTLFKVTKHTKKEYCYVGHQFPNYGWGLRCGKKCSERKMSRKLGLMCGKNVRNIKICGTKNVTKMRIKVWKAMCETKNVTNKISIHKCYTRCA